MEFIKYKDILAKVISKDSYSLQVLSQEPETFTHLSLFVSKKDTTPVSKVSHMDFNSFIKMLDDQNFYSDIVPELMMFDNYKQLVRVITSKSLEKASDLNIWIDDLHDVDYQSVISEIIKKYEI